MSEDGPTASRDTALQAACDAWLEHLAARGRAANTLEAYRGDLRHYVRMMVGLGLSDPAMIGPDDVETFVLALATEPGRQGRVRADTTVARVLSAVRGLHGWLADTGRTVDDPSAGVASPQAVRAAPVSLEVDEVAVLLSFEPDPGEGLAALRDRAMLRLLVATGVRAAELVDLDVADVDQDARRIHVRGDRPRPLRVPDPRSLRDWLQRRPELEASCDALFPNLRGERISRQGVWRIVTDRAVDAGLPPGTSPRVLRNTFAAVERAAGTPEPLVRELLGTAPWTGAADREAAGGDGPASAGDGRGRH